MNPTDQPGIRASTLQRLTYIARTIVQQEIACKGEICSRRAYWHLAEAMREAADGVERDAGRRADYARDVVQRLAA